MLPGFWSRGEFMKLFQLRMAVAALFAFLAGPASAEVGAAFFDGKTVTYIVATDPGGGYDTNGRLVAEFMQKHLPGSTFVVRNMPGAGQIIGANFIHAAEPDGLTIGTFNTGLIYAQLAGKAGVRFDLSRMSWIGKVASDPRVIVVSRQSGIDDFAQLAAMKTPTKFAAPGVGSASAIETALLVNALKLPIKIITGYNGDEDQLALMRGEVQGIVGSRSSFQRFVDEGHGKMIAQIGGTPADVPMLATMIDGDAGRKVLALVESQGDIARVTAGPPRIPEDRLEALREAYAAATADPEFLAKAKKLGLPVDPATGGKLAAAVVQALDQTPEMVGFLRDNSK
jgi:tripartite-type tricarboxylate transporter receptor subunit TctC